jgi:hypothetical protein
MLGRSWDKNLKTFAPCYSQSLHQLILPSTASPMVFLDLRFLQQQLKVDEGWLCLHYLFDIAEKIRIVLSLITLHFLYKYIQIETTITNAPKGGKHDRNPFHPNGFRNPYKIMEKTKVCSRISYCRNYSENLKSEKNRKISLGNLNENVLP